MRPLRGGWGGVMMAQRLWPDVEPAPARRVRRRPNRRAIRAAEELARRVASALETESTATTPIGRTVWSVWRGARYAIVVRCALEE